MKRLLFISLLLPVFVNAQIITTVAGGGTSIANGAPALSANLQGPFCPAIDSHGNLYFCSGGGFIKMVSTSGFVYNVAGSGMSGFGGDSGLATSARLAQLSGLAIDTAGNIFIADLGNARIRKVDATTGIITTYAGNGVRNSLGDSGLATLASLVPENVCTDRFGNVFVLDSQSRVRKIDASGIITTIAGNGTVGFTGDSGLATSAEIAESYGLCADIAGNVYIGCYGRIRKVEVSTGIITTVAGNGNDFYIGDGMHADSAQFDPYLIAVDLFGNLYIGIPGATDRVCQINTANIFLRIAGNGIDGFSGDGGPADSAKVYNPDGVVTDSCGNVYFADGTNHRIRKITFDSSCGRNDSILIVKSMSPIGLSLYPNPATTQLTISAQDRITNIAISNLMGQVVYTNQYNSQQVQVDIADLTAGVYFVKVNGVEVRKFVKE